jgi:hypothetical protein
MGFGAIVLGLRFAKWLRWLRELGLGVSEERWEDFFVSCDNVFVEVRALLGWNPCQMVLSDVRGLNLLEAID